MVDKIVPPAESIIWIEKLQTTVDDQISLSKAIVDLFRDGALDLDDEHLVMVSGQAIKRIIPLMIHSAALSSMTAKELAVDFSLKTRYGYILARGFIETIVNILYIISNKEEVAKKAERHALQKSIREINKESIFFKDVSAKSVLSDSFFERKSPRVDESKAARPLKEALDEFTSKRGREKNWTDDSLQERLTLLRTIYGNKSMFGLKTAEYMIYQVSSEIIHGSYFGALFSMGSYGPGGPPSTMEAMAEKISQQCINILLSMAFAWDAFYWVIAKIANSEYLRGFYRDFEKTISGLVNGTVNKKNTND